MPETTGLVQSLVRKYGARRENILPILQDIVEKNHYLTEKSMRELAKALDISAAEVYGTASFYSFLDTQPRGENVIRICKTITCYMKGKDDIIKAIEERLNIKLGETTSDGKFSFLAANCIGWCHEGPAMLINNKVYTKLTPKKVVQIINEYYDNGR